MSDAAFPDYIVTSTQTSAGFYIFVLGYTAICFLLIAPLVAWSRNTETKRLHEDETIKDEQQVIATNTNKSTQQKNASSQLATPMNKGTAVSSLASESHAAPPSVFSLPHSVRSGKSGLSLILFMDKVAAAEYPDKNPDFQTRVSTQNSRSGTAQSTNSGMHSAATTSRLHHTKPKNLSSLVLDVGGRRWKNRRPIGRVDVICHAISSTKSSVSALSSAISRDTLPTATKRPVNGMSDLANSVLQEQNDPTYGHFMHTRNPTMIQHNRARFLRRPSRAGSHSAASELSLERSIMSSIVDDISPNDAADANDPGRGNLFLQPQDLDSSGVKCGWCSGFLEALLALAAPGEEMKRVVHSSIPLSLGAMSEALVRLVLAGFISRYLGTESMIAFLLVGLFVRLTSEELSGAIIDAASTFIQAHLFSGGDTSHFLAGQYIQHAIVLQLLLGIPLLLVWALTMDVVVFWLVQSENIANIALDYARVVVFYYLVQSITRTCTVVFHICGQEHFESVIDIATLVLKLIIVACVVALVEDATLMTVGYIQVLIGVAGALVKIMFPVIRGWMKPFRKGFLGQVAFLHDRHGFQQLARAVFPLTLGAILEYGEWEMLTLCVRFLGPAEVAGWVILGALWDILEALTEGIGEAVATQVAFLLSVCQPERARRLSNTVMYLAVVQSLMVTSCLYMFGKYLAIVLTTDPTLQHLINDSIGLLGLANVTMAFAEVSWSLVGAQGRFRLATSVVFLARGFVTIPVALLIILVWELDLDAVGGALGVGYATAASTLTFIVLRSDWERLSRIMQDMKVHEQQLFDDDHGDPFEDNDENDDDDDDDDSSSEGFGFGGVDDEESEAMKSKSRTIITKAKSTNLPTH